MRYGPNSVRHGRGWPEIPKDVQVGQFVLDEENFLSSAEVDRCAVALALIPLHIRQRRRIMHMLWLNEEWRRADGHITGVLTLEQFEDSIIYSLQFKYPAESKNDISSRIKRIWAIVLKGHDVIKHINGAMDFEAFCNAMTMLFYQ